MRFWGFDSLDLLRSGQAVKALFSSWPGRLRRQGADLVLRAARERLG